MVPKKKEQYVGTKGLTLTTSLNRVFEIMDKNPVGTKEEEYYQESKQVILQELELLAEKDKAIYEKEKYLKSLLTTAQKLKYITKYDENNQLLDEMLKNL